MLLYGQEDDDFAYEDEHIEMESENQEHDDLDEREFDTEGAVIRGEAKSPVPTTISTLPRPAPKPTLAGTVPDANGHGLLQSHPPLRITSANASGLGLRGRLEPVSGPPNQNPIAGRARTKLAETSPKGLSE